MNRFSAAPPFTQHEHDAVLRGEAAYTSDVALPGQQHACFVRSPYAHARILSIDSQEARKVPGVIAVVTGEDLASLGSIAPLPGATDRHGRPMVDAGIPVLAQTVARYVGEAVALVVARDAQAAQDAAEQVFVEWEPLAAVIDPLAAMQPDAPRLHDPACADNIALDWERGAASPELDAIFSAAATVVSVDLADPPLTACALEPRAAVANWDPIAQRFTLIASTQGVNAARKVLAEQVFRVPADRVRVVTPRVGGGFGAKAQVYGEYAALMWASRLTGQPVKWTATRMESFLTDTHSRNGRLQARIAFDANGRMLAVDADVVLGIGAYTSSFIGIVSTTNIYNCLSSVYAVPAIRLRSRLVFTNAMPSGPYRGAGRPAAVYMLERALDMAAHQMKIDRVDLRRRNLVPAGAMPYKAANGQVYDSGEFEQVLDKALQLADWDGFDARRKASEARGMLRGIGLGCFLEVAGGVLEEPAELRFEDDGMVAAHLGAQGMGQGVETTYRNLVAQRLGVSPARVRVVTGDSDLVPGVSPTVASRTTMMAGSALILACDEAVRRGRLIAANMLEVAPDDLIFRAGEYRVAGTDTAIDLLELAARLKGAAPTQEHPETLDNLAHFASSSMSFPNGCHVSEVEVDCATGLVTILRHTAVDDVGVILDEAIVEGQVMGGVVQGLGQVFGEVLHYDSDGQLLNASFMDYPVFRACDAPPIVVAQHVTHCTTNPLGVKGAGESGVAGAIPAAVNAVLDAMGCRGVHEMDMPFTPARVWSAVARAAG